MKLLSALFLLFITCFSAGYTQFVKADGAQIFCKVIGKGDPIVIIHGGPGLTHEYLAPQMAKLAETNLVIFYDQRACGQSTGEINSDSIQLDVFVEDLECLRKSFGFKRMTVLGHSWGGFLAMKYAISHPESVNKLILLNTMSPSSDDLALFIKEWMRRMAPYQGDLKSIQETQGFLNGDPSTIERYYQLVFKNYCYLPEKANLLNLRMTPKASVDGAKVYEIFRQNVFAKPFNLHEQLKKLKVPTLIVHGDADPIPHSTAQRIHESIPNSSYILLKDCGHFPYVEAPDVLFKHLNAFLHREEVLHVLEECYDSLYPAKEKSSQAFTWFTEIPHTRFNVVTHLSWNGDLTSKIDEMIANAPAGMPLSFWGHPVNQAKNLPAVLLEKGFSLYGRFPGMIWFVEPVSEPKLEVRPAEDMGVFHQILAETLHYQENVRDGFAHILKNKHVENYLVYIDGKAVGTGTLWFKEKKGVLMNVMILPEFQKKGAGRAMSQHLMKRAHALGLEEVVLRSSPAAEKLYTSLGFQKTYDIDVYVRAGNR